MSSALQMLLVQDYLIPKFGICVEKLNFRDTIKICRNSDIIQFSYICFESLLLYDDLYSAIMNSNFIVNNDNYDIVNNILNLKMSFLFCINDIYHTFNEETQMTKYYIKIPNFIINRLSSISVSSNFIINLNLPDSITNVSIINHLICYGTTDRTKIATTSFSKKDQISYNVPFVSQISNTLKFETYIPYYTKGFFVYGKDINKILSIDILVINKQIISYDRDFIVLFCDHINSNIFYVGYNGTIKYDDMSDSSIVGLIGVADVTTINIVVDNIKNPDINVYALCSVFLNYNISDVHDTKTLKINTYARYDIIKKY